MSTSGVASTGVEGTAKKSRAGVSKVYTTRAKVSGKCKASDPSRTSNSRKDDGSITGKYLIVYVRDLIMSIRTLDSRLTAVLIRALQRTYPVCSM